jgi:hypothetical protein
MDRCRPTLTCIPPEPLSPYPLGDVVPLGLLLRALGPGEPAEGAPVRGFLKSRRQGRLYSFHSGILPTALDTALVLLGLPDSDALEELERFSDGSGGYFPQLFGPEGAPGVMHMTGATRHWCQTDFGTTCLVRAVRRAAGLAPKTSAAYLEARFEERAGIFFPNAYLTDWALAMAVADDPDAAALGARLAAEIGGSANPDGSFGRYDVALSTALAVLALVALDEWTGVERAAERLAELQQPDGLWPACTPFHSTMVLESPRLPPSAAARLLLRGRFGQYLLLDGRTHGVTFWHDGDRVLTSSLAALALQAMIRGRVRGATGSAGRAAGAPHARYGYRDALDYNASSTRP